MTLGEKLKSIRREQGLSQAKVAEDAKISRRSYISYEQDSITPKKRETYENLAEALNCDVDELLMYKDATTVSAIGGAAAAIAVLAPILGTATLPMGTLVGASMAALAASKAKKSTAKNEDSSDPLTYNNDMLLQYEKKQRTFQAIAIGIIYSKLASDGIAFQPGNKDDLDSLGGKPDEYIKITGESESEWWLSFWAKDEKLDKNVIMTEDDRAAVMISRFATAKFDENRKITIVVDDETLYDAILNYKNHNSLRVNMSVMLIDGESVAIVREETIATV